MNPKCSHSEWAIKKKKACYSNRGHSHKGKYFAVTLDMTFLTLFSIFCFITSCTSTSARVLKSTANFLFFSPSFFSSMSSWKRASCCLHARAMLAAFSETQSSSRRISDISEPCFSVAAVNGIGTHPQLSTGKVQECERESSSESDVRVPLALVTTCLAVKLVSRAQQLVCIIVTSSVWKSRYHPKFETYFFKSFKNIYSLKNPLDKELRMRIYIIL